MGLSRNKVAVSEGAAGSPPFYGDREAKFEANLRPRSQIRTKNLTERLCTHRSSSNLLFNCQASIKKSETENP